MELSQLATVEKAPLSRLNPITKLVLVASLAVLSITVDNIDTLKVICLVSLVVYALAKPNLEKIKLTALLLALTTWSTVFSQALFYSGYPRTPIVVLVPPETPVIGWLTGGVYVYLEGLEYGLKQSIRLVTTLIAALAVAWTTDPKDLMTCLSSLGVSRALTLSVMISMRFTPIFASDIASTLTILRLRGVTLRKEKPHTLFKYARKLLTPLYASLVRRARILSIAIESRGYSASSKHVKYKVVYSKADILIIISSTAVTLIIVLLKLLFYAYTCGAYYNPQLVGIYAFVRKYL